MLVLSFSLSGKLIAQKSDYTWLAGYASSSHNAYDSAINGYTYGNIKLDFNENPVAISFDSLQMNFVATNTTFCNDDGNLLFYSNGIYVANGLDETIANGDSLNAGYLQYVWDTTIMHTGYRVEQGIVPIQSLSASNEFYLFPRCSKCIADQLGTADEAFESHDSNNLRCRQL